MPIPILVFFILVGATALIFGIMSFVQAYECFREKRWDLAITGACLGMFICGTVGTVTWLFLEYGPELQ